MRDFKIWLFYRGFNMRIDSNSWRLNKRVCISIDDDLFDAFCKFQKKVPEYSLKMIRRKITSGEIKNSYDAKIFIYSVMMKPSAFSCFTLPLPDQVHLEDLC